MPSGSIRNDIDALLQYEEYLKWRSQFPVGYLLAQQLEKNSKEVFNRDLEEMYNYERTHIADPEDYVGTRPDNEVRWKI